MKKINDIAVGDLWPFPYFRLWETIYSGGKFVTQEMSLATDFSSLKVSIRHEDNKTDINDHASDDIYADVTIDSGGLCHYEWQATETDKPGKYIGRLVGVRTTGSRPWHSKDWFTYYVVPKGRYGRSTS